MVVVGERRATSSRIPHGPQATSRHGRQGSWIHRFGWEWLAGAKCRRASLASLGRLGAVAVTVALLLGEQKRANGRTATGDHDGHGEDESKYNDVEATVQRVSLPRSIHQLLLAMIMVPT